MMNPRTISPGAPRSIEAQRAVSALEALAARLERELERHAAAHGLTDAKLVLLQTLDCCAEGCAGLCSIGDSMGVSRPNVTKLVDGLERTGLVERTPHATDRRRVQARLTPEGRRVVRAASPGRSDVRARIWDHLTDDELDEIGALLRVAADPGGPPDGLARPCGPPGTTTP